MKRYKDFLEITNILSCFGWKGPKMAQQYWAAVNKTKIPKPLAKELYDFSVRTNTTEAISQILMKGQVDECDIRRIAIQAPFIKYGAGFGPELVKMGITVQEFAQLCVSFSKRAGLQ